MHFDFLLCSERSGSNLITKLLDAHPEICGPFPRHAMRSFGLNLYRYGDITKDANWELLVDDMAAYQNCGFSVWATHFDARGLYEAVKTRSLGALIRHIYETEARAQGKTRLFVKENHAYELLPFTLSHFPDARFVWLVRDPRDMALTWKEAFVYGGVKAGSAMWLRDQRASRQVYGMLRDSGRILRVRYEDLVNHTTAELTRLCGFLGVAYSEQMMQFHQKPVNRKNADHNILGGWKDLKNPITAAHVGRYRRDLDVDEIRYVEACCREEMRYFGYEPDFEADIDVGDLEQRLPDEAAVVSPERAAVQQKHFENFHSHLRIITRRRPYGGEPNTP